MNLLSTDIKGAIETYTQLLEHRIRFAGNGKLVGEVGDISKLRRDLSELQLMLRDLEWNEQMLVVSGRGK